MTEEHGDSDADDTSEEIAEGRWGDLARLAGQKLESLGERVERAFDRRFRPDRPIQAVIFRGHGRRGGLGQLSGRVLFYKRAPAGDSESLWRRLGDTYRRFETDEVPGVTVEIIAPDRVVSTVTDEEGYFHGSFEIPAEVHEGVLPVVVRLPAFPGALVHGDAELVIPSAAARFGVISDIDDTVLVTEATSVLKMMRLTLLGSARSRVAFPGVAALYQALHGGLNPFFYVSSSPWNLYEFLGDFMGIQGLVPGPLMLRDFGLDEDRWVAGGHGEHKLGAARAILAAHPGLTFLLIGDSGQKDPVIYRTLVEEHPGRIGAVYIREAGPVDAREAAEQELSAVRALGVPAAMVADSGAAAAAALEDGWIHPDALGEIQSRSLRDLGCPEPDALP